MFGLFVFVKQRRAMNHVFCLLTGSSCPVYVSRRPADVDDFHNQLIGALMRNSLLTPAIEREVLWLADKCESSLWSASACRLRGDTKMAEFFDARARDFAEHALHVSLPSVLAA